MPASYKIPQNVDLEDKIFGPLTLKQFLFALGAGLTTFIAFNVFWTVSPPLFIIITFFIWVVAGAFIFVRPNDQPFSRFAYAFLWFTLKPQRRVWKRIPSLGDVHLVEHRERQLDEGPHRPSAAEAKSRLSQLAHLVDTRGWSDVDDEADLGERVTSGAVKPKLNIAVSDSDAPEDILEAEDEQHGTGRATAELDRVLRRGIPKPTIEPEQGRRAERDSGPDSGLRQHDTRVSTA